MGGMGVGCKNVENETGAVQDPAFETFLKIPNLRGAQLIVDNRQPDVFGLDVLMDLLQLAGTEVSDTAGTFHGLNETGNRHTSRGLQQESQLVKVFFRALTALLPG